jgi:hypothetical protein
MSNFNARDIPTHSSEVHQYNVNWVALENGDNGVELKVDANGDGRFESMLSSDADLSQEEFNNNQIKTSESSGSSGGSGTTALLTVCILISLLAIGLGVGYVAVFRKEQILSLLQPSISTSYKEGRTNDTRTTKLPEGIPPRMNSPRGKPPSEPMMPHQPEVKPKALPEEIADEIEWPEWG